MLFGKADTARADYTVTVNPAQSWGVWQGWGCSLSWWATVFGDRDDVADLLFTRKSILLVDSVGSQTLPGLGLNVIRYNVGGTGEAAAIVDGTLRPRIIPRSSKSIRGSIPFG